MNEISREEIETILSRQKAFFATHQTKNVDFRIEQLSRLKKAILKNEDKITNALYKDLHKSKEEAYLTEISIVLSEINNHIKNLKKWAKPKRVKSEVALFPSQSKIIYEPLGVALIIAPWNYPFQLLINPLVGAISAGCCVVLKSSPYVPHIVNVMEKLIQETFSPEYVCFTKGGREMNTILLNQQFDYIFFTGSPALGKVVMKQAAQHLTPVTLELGGKSPCIVDRDANIQLAARRIAWGKTINAGQTCVAPDYLFLHEEIKEQFIEQIKVELRVMLGENPKESRHYARIVDSKAFDRLKNLMQCGKMVVGGVMDEEERYIAPTLLDNIKMEDAIMQEEIFGPLLPIIDFTELDEVIAYINSQPKPLALYYFGTDKKSIDKILHKTSSGGACINDTLMHIANHHLPFGGVGNSGTGKYHGYDSFLTFSNRKAVVKTPISIDVFLRYAPYKYFAWIKKMMK